MSEIYVIEKSCNNVWTNLAFETCLLEYVNEQTEKFDKTITILYLWQNDKSVVIGRHQNPSKECNIAFVNANEVKIARRISGGGAVYHDFGNLNFTFIQSKKIYQDGFSFSIITESLDKLGINVVLSERNDILMNGKKISGSAFYQTKNVKLHHGTLLIDANLKVVNNSLTPDKIDTRFKSVNSVKSEIANIRDEFPNICKSAISENIKNVFLSKFSYDAKKSIDIDSKRMKILYEKYSSTEWVFGNYSKV